MSGGLRNNSTKSWPRLGFSTQHQQCHHIVSMPPRHSASSEASFASGRCCMSAQPPCAQTASRHGGGCPRLWRILNQVYLNDNPLQDMNAANAAYAAQKEWKKKRSLCDLCRTLSQNSKVLKKRLARRNTLLETLGQRRLRIVTKSHGTCSARHWIWFLFQTSCCCEAFFNWFECAASLFRGFWCHPNGHATGTAAKFRQSQ